MDGRGIAKDPVAVRSHLEYLERRWIIVAARAWREYLTNGRGALLFTPSAERAGDWDYVYLPLDLIEGEPLMTEYSTLLTSYDPTKQMVAMFLTPPSLVSAYCGPSTPDLVAPPEAHERIGAAPNWN
jgi:hypothetical protein